MYKHPVLNILYIFLASLCTISAAAQGDFTITGKLSGEQQGVVMFSYTQYINGSEVSTRDSAIVKDGQFLIKGNLTYPVEASINFFPVNRTERSQGFYRSFYLDAAHISIEGAAGLDKATINGGKSLQEYDAWQQRRKLLDDSIRTLFAPGHDLGAAMNGEAIRELQKKGAPMQKRLDKIDSAFISDNPDSQVAYDLRFKRALKGKLEITETETALNRFTENVRNNPPAMLLKARLLKAKALQHGQAAPDFTLNDIDGKPVSLSSYKGRYVLLVFNHYTGTSGLNKLVFNFTRAYNSIKTNNFALLTVTSDKNAASVKEFIAKNGMNWTHLMRTEKDSIEEKYDVGFHDEKVFLVGPDGKFVMTDINNGSDVTTQIKYSVPGAEKSVAASYASTSGKGPLNVFLGDEITEYPQVEWLKGGPVTKFDKDKIYIVELWATWCVPCIAAMPHLSDLQRKFKDKNVIIIAQGVWENDKTKAANFVKTKGKDLNYLVAFSGQEDSDFFTRWCIPAQLSGIPQTFVIQNGRLVWQTYPTNLNDEILQLLIDKQFTIAKAEALITKN